MNFSALFPRSYNLSCAVLEVIVEKEKSQNLHLFYSNLILCHYFTLNTAKFISIAVHKEIVLFIHKGTWFLWLKLNFLVVTLPLWFVHHVLYFASRFVSFSIYLFNNFLWVNKKASSIQSTPHTSANHLIFYTSPVSFVMGLKLLEFK